jgi:arginase
MTETIVVGSPTSLGGHLAGMERTPTELRRRGLLDVLAARPGLAGMTFRDAGDAPVEPGWAPDPDPRAKNRALLIGNLPRIAEHVVAALEATRSDARLLLLGGDCTSHAAALAGLRHVRPGLRLALAWFDAHGDFNTPDSTPSGNVWGMPLAMACGYGESDLLAAVDAPTVEPRNAALLGGQVLDEDESRRLAASPLAHFGAGMLADEAGRAALRAWATAVAGRVDAAYIAFDLDALDSAAGWAVTMPEPHGLALADAVAAVRILAGTLPVVGFGATAALFEASTNRAVAARTVEAVADLAETALG